MTERDHASDDSTGTDRRTTLKLLGAVGATGLAGCFGDDDGETPTDGKGTPTDTNGTPTDTPPSGGASFGVSELDPTEATATQGDTIAVSATVTNTGDASGSGTVAVAVDGEEVASEEVSLDAGGSTSVTFDVDTTGVATGDHTHTVSIGSSEVSGTFTLEAAPTSEDLVDVLYLGGVEDGATHYSEDLMKLLTPYMLRNGIQVHYTERQEDLNSDTLAAYDAVMIYGNRLEPTEEQMDALVNFVEDGGGFVPVHSASACFGAFGGAGDDELAQQYVSLVGGAFQSHGTGEMTTDRVGADHPVFEGTEAIESPWEETYQHTDVADDIEVLAYGAGHPDYDGIDEPFTWVREQGDGRVFYTAWGHDERTWQLTGFQQLLTNGVRWAAGAEDELGNFEGSAVPEKSYTNVSEYGHDQIPYYQGEAPDAVSSGDDGVWDLVQDAFSPEESMQHAITPGELELEYFVSEEQYPDGVQGEILDFTFDAAGRCWMALTQDYPNDGGTGNDSIVIAEDTDGDGVAEEFTLFQEGLSIPHSIIPHRDGVIVAEVGTDESGRVVYVGDEDGDGRADTEEEIFRGYGTGDTHAGLNQLYWGHDNWVYGVVGYSGLTPSISEDLHLSQDLFRFRPDGSEIEYVGGGASNMAGVKTNEEGLVFCSSATAGNNVTSYAAIPATYYDYIDEFEGLTTTDIRLPYTWSRTEDENRYLPVNDRYRQVDFQDGYTAATDQEIYTAREFPEQYWNSTTFVSDGTGQLTGTFYLEQSGASYESIYHHNLFASNDEWSTPTYVNTGPDGMVWLNDMYDFVCQHNPTPAGYENGAGNAYQSNVRDSQHARLYRVTTGEDVDLHPHDLSDADASELVEVLENDNMFWRKTAQRKLIEMEATGVVDDLVEMATTENIDDVGLDPGAIHALWTLEGLGAIEDNVTDLADALTHSAAAVRLNAVRVMPGTETVRDAILEADLLNDDDGRVRMWALLKMGEMPESDAAGEAIYEMISQEQNAEDNLLLDAASVGAATHGESFVEAYEANEDLDGGDDDEGPQNVFENPSFEESDAEVGPNEWDTQTWGGSADHTWTDVDANSGDYSVEISSEEGVDGAWFTTVEVEPDTDYTLSGYVKTGEDFEVGDGFGAQLNVHELGQESLTDSITEAGTDWTEVSITVNSGDNETLQINCLLGGWGTASGTAWYDDIRFEDPDGNDLITNGGFEEGTTSESPTAWETNNWQGTEVTFTHDSSVSHTGDYSVKINSSEGADASWTQTFEVQPNTQYRFSAYIKTSEEFEPTSGFGATLNVHELGQDSLPDLDGNAITEAGQDWTEVSTTINSGSNTTLTFNCLYGGWGLATGPVWWDDASLEPLGGFGEGHEQVYNRVLNHLGIPGGGGDDGDDDTADDMPAEWTTNTFAGSPSFDYVTGTVSDGDRSVSITAEGGTDAGWSIVDVPVEPDTDYTLSAMVKTENVEVTDSPPDWAPEGAPFGACLNVEELANGEGLGAEAISDDLKGTNDWTELTLEFNSIDYERLQFNCLFGAYGSSATGTVWFDEVSVVGPDGENVVPNPSFEQAPSDALDSATTIEFSVESNNAWTGVAPASIEGENPTLTLQAGETYTLEWTNNNGGVHNFEIEAESGDTPVATDTMSTEGETQTVEFTATEGMTTYYCNPHRGLGMEGDIEIV